MQIEDEEPHYSKRFKDICQLGTNEIKFADTISSNVNSQTGQCQPCCGGARTFALADVFSFHKQKESTLNCEQIL